VCKANCKVDQCTALGITTENVACMAGQCVAGINCAGTVTCRAAPPTCERGFVPAVVGNCWGGCVPASQCGSVRDCNDCAWPEQSCASYLGLAGPINHCYAIPERCRNNPTCECLGESVCTPPYGLCTDRSGIPGVVCACASC